MKRFAIVLAAVLLGSGSANAAVIFSSSPNAPFAANSGVVVALANPLSVYTIVTEFSFDITSGYRKIVDFKDRSSDTGLYNLSNFLNFYPVTTSATPAFQPSQLARLTLSRDVTGLVTSNVSGTTAQISFLDAGGAAVFSNNVIRLFQDDFPTGQGEASSGFLKSVKIYDTATAPLGVPEPATWALMLLGFGAVGAGMRRRQRISVRFT